METLAEVLIGRDRPPAWRSDGARRTAALLGWIGWIVLALSGLAAVTIGSRGDHASTGRGLGLLGWLAVALAVTAALPLTHRYALLAWRVAFLGLLITPWIPGQTRADAGYYLVLAVALAVAGIRYGPRHLWWMFALSLIPVWLWTGPDWVYPAANTTWLVLLAAAVHAVAYWRRDRRALVTQTEHAERQRERNAVLEERARIAREMHDVVAHHMSMIAVQAETAPYRLAAKGTETPEPVAEEFAALSAAAREALTDMRHLLGVLRSDPAMADNSKRRGSGGSGSGGSGSGGSGSGGSGGDGAGSDGAGGEEWGGDGGVGDRVPQPRLEDIPELIEAARRAGTKVSLAMPEPLTCPVPHGAGLAAYRIVQESLSNAARHAPCAEVTVWIDQAEGTLRVAVINDPPALFRNAPANTGSAKAGSAKAGSANTGSGSTRSGSMGNGEGHGITGMRERAALLGGTLDAGPQDDGGFAVRALLPAGITP